MKKRYFVIISIVIIIILGGLAKALFFSGNKNQNEEIFRVRKDNVIKAVYETGTVKKGEEINLSFNFSGTIKNIQFPEGKKVKKGDVLAELDNTDLKLQLRQAQANLDAYQAQLDKLLAGPTQEEIALAQTNVESAKVSYENAKENLEKVKNSAEKQLEFYYRDAISKIDNAVLRLFDARNFVDKYKRTYFFRGDQVSIIVDYKKRDLDKIYQELAQYQEEITQANDFSLIDQYLPYFQSKIYQAKQDLDVIKEKSEDPFYRNLISSSDKTLLDNHRYYLSVAYTNINAAISSIDLQKGTNDQNISQAEQALDAAYYSLKTAQENLEKLTAKPRKEDIEYYQAQIDSVKQQIALLNYKIKQTKIIAPVAGEIAQILKQEGESVQMLEPVIIFIPEKNYYIEVNIYEEDLPKVQIGSKVIIEPVAYPDKQLTGEVYFISPKETIINDIVYYPVKISFNNNLGLKPGMSVDLTIVSEERNDVLVVNSESIYKENDREFVWLKTKEGKEKRYIKTGLWGSNDLVEILEGLKEGDELIIEK